MDGVMNKLDCMVLVCEWFGFDLDLMVFVFGMCDDYVFDIDDVYCFNLDVMFVIFVGFVCNCCVFV